jgi:putative transposase
LGLSGRVPPRVDQATKAGLLDLLEQACGQGWTVRGACRALEVSELRIYRWLGRRAAGELEDHAPGGSLMHGLLDWEVAEGRVSSSGVGEDLRMHPWDLLCGRGE